MNMNSASEFNESKAQPFLPIEELKADSRASSLGHYQAKCKRDNFIVLISPGEHAKFKHSVKISQK